MCTAGIFRCARAGLGLGYYIVLLKINGISNKPRTKI